MKKRNLISIAILLLFSLGAFAVGDHPFQILDCWYQYSDGQWNYFSVARHEQRSFLHPGELQCGASFYEPSWNYDVDATSLDFADVNGQSIHHPGPWGPNEPVKVLFRKYSHVDPRDGEGPDGDCKYKSAKSQIDWSSTCELKRGDWCMIYPQYNSHLLSFMYYLKVDEVEQILNGKGREFCKSHHPVFPKSIK